MSALAMRLAASRVGLRTPRSTMLMYVGWSPDRSAIFSWDMPAEVRRARTADPKSFEMLEPGIGRDFALYRRRASIDYGL